MELSTLLLWGKQQLLAESDTAALDAEILLAHVLKVSRSYVLAFSEREINLDEKHAFEKLIEQRKQQIPIAYLLGHKEFWSLDLVVTRDTLVPRPETELLVELVIREIQGENKIIADLGTGAGAIALAIAHECPTWTVYATDASEKALRVAELNAMRLEIKNVIFKQGVWCAALPLEIKLDALVSNPPYIASDDPHLEQGALRHEPQAALVAKENGLHDIYHLIDEARNYFKSGGKIFLEHGAEQGSAVRKRLAEYGYRNINSYCDLNHLERVTLAEL